MKNNERKHTNQLQARHLNERVKAKERNLISDVSDLWLDRKEPATVKHARAMVSKWDKSEYQMKNNIRKHGYDAINREVKKVRERILFDSPADALKAVKSFECFSLEHKDSKA